MGGRGSVRHNFRSPGALPLGVGEIRKWRPGAAREGALQAQIRALSQGGVGVRGRISEGFVQGEAWGKARVAQWGGLQAEGTECAKAER